MMSYESTWKRRKKRRKAKDGKSGAAGMPLRFFVFRRRFLSNQSCSFYAREKRNDAREKQRLRREKTAEKNFSKKIKKILDRENELVYYNHS